MPRTIEFEVSEISSGAMTLLHDRERAWVSITGDIYEVFLNDGRSRRLISGREWFSELQSSPDKRLVAAIASEQSFGSGVWVIDRNGNDKRLVREGRFTNVAWSPDGRTLWVVGSGNSIIGLDPHTGSQQIEIELKKGLPGGYPTQHPEAALLFYAQQESWNSATNVVQYDFDTGSHKVVFSEGTRISRLTISPDGQRLYYLSKPIEYGVGDLELRELNLHSLSSRIIATIGDVERPPSMEVTQDGSRIFIPIGGRLVSITIDTSQHTTIPFKASISKVLPPSVSPKARYTGHVQSPKQLRWTTAAISEQEFVFSVIGQVWIYDLNENQSRRLTQNEELEYAPAISPDGNKVAYVSWTDHAMGQVKTAFLDGTNQRTVSNRAGFYTNPTWSPDGKKVAYLAAPTGEERSFFQNQNSMRPIMMEIRVVDLESSVETVLHTIAAPIRSLNRVYTPLQFSADGSRIIFQTLHENTFPFRREMNSVALDGKDVKRHLIYDQKVDHVVVSPNMREFAIVRRSGLTKVRSSIELLELNDTTFDGEEFDPKTLEMNRATYASWGRNGLLYASFKNELWSMTPNGEARLLAEVPIPAVDHEPASKVAFTNARIVTMSDLGTIDRGAIEFEGTRITFVGQTSEYAPDPGTYSIDADGYTIIPGLIDAHAHLHPMQLGGAELFPEVKKEYASKLAYGVTTVFDPAAPLIDVNTLTEMVSNDRVIGPRIFSTGDVLNPFYDTLHGVSFASFEAADVFVRQMQDGGATMIKSYGQTDPEEREHLVRSGIKNGIPIIGHSDRNPIGDVLLAMEGFSVLEHMPQLSPMYSDVLQLFSKAEVHVTPTINVSIGANQGAPFALFESGYEDDRKFQDFVAPTLNASFAAVDDHLLSRILLEDMFYQRGLKDIASMIDAGVLVSVGSHSSHGVAMHWEMALYQEAGVPPWEVLKAATIVGAEKLGIENVVGSLEVGKLADLVVLSSDPLINIRYTEDIFLVVKDGRIYHADTMTRLYPEFDAFVRSPRSAN